MCGPINVETLSKNRTLCCLLMIILVMTWVYFVLSNNTQVLYVFKKFKVLVEKQSVVEIAYLR